MCHCVPKLQFFFYVKQKQISVNSSCYENRILVDAPTELEKTHKDFFFKKTLNPQDEKLTFVKNGNPPPATSVNEMF